MKRLLSSLVWLIPVMAMSATVSSNPNQTPPPPKAKPVLAAPASPPTPPQTATPSQAPPRDRGTPKPSTGIIRGRVVAADTGGPLGRVRLALSAPEVGKPSFTTTDGQGRYEFALLPAARYTLAASKSGYLSLPFGQRRAFEAGTPIEIGDAQVLEKIDLALPRGGVITGRVIDEVGEPVAGARMSAMRPRYSEGGRQLVGVGRAVETDDRGEYRLFGLAPGSYYVSTASPLFGDPLPFASVYYPGTANPADAERVVVKAGQVRTSIDLRLQPMPLGTLSGTLTHAARGGPLTEGTIRASGAAGSMRLAGAVRPDGTFTIPNVPPGEYSLIATGREAESVSSLYGLLPVTVTGGDVGGLFIDLTPGGRATGQIVFEGVATPPFLPATVGLFSEPVRAGGFLAGPVGTIKGDWTFELTGQLGERLLRLSRLSKGWALKSVLLDGRDITDRPLVFTGHEDISGIRIVLTSRTTTVSGRVTDARGQPERNYTVVVFAENAARWTVRSRFIATGRPALDGRFTITQLPPDSYLIAAVEYLEEGESSDPDILESLRARATRILLAEGESATVELKLITDVR
jgi:hypothetical protein